MSTINPVIKEIIKKKLPVKIRRQELKLLDTDTSAYSLFINNTLNPFIKSNREKANKYKQHYLDAIDGDAKAQFYMGYYYDIGEGLEQDFKRAAFWYKKAAKQNESAAQYNLGLLYKSGSGVKQDLNHAASYFFRAAKLGYLPAQKELGILLIALDDLFFMQ